MKRTTILYLLILFIGGPAAFAQHARFPSEGTIEFEKSVNMYALIKKEINKDNEMYLKPAFEDYQKKQPQFKIMKSTLTFSKQKSIYKPEAEQSGSDGFFGDDAMSTQPNTIYTDLGTGSSIAQKKVFEETFLVKDSLRKINWKITNETREIAGYTCRRANALVLDSVYIVAFYTDRIPVSGGPESFSGLPGMILGVAIPHENITWFAKLVTDKPVAPAAIVSPTKGKATDNKKFRETLNSVMKDWGDYAQSSLKAFLL